ncbi:HEPN domain-containing protein [Methanolapillus ohkumae]|uniref:HEPN domain-containing protein n=1 Tax=Methanolapillus ohkumae TaxID=3028298 RepID=A0AA96V5N9_9EURY|nr:hypothetical protein MsAm2_01110 [Methanosarcinaceae archaeon Am2]
MTIQFKPAHFLYISRFLVQTVKKEGSMSESFYKTAISRAYYAAFLESRIYAEKRMNFIGSKTGIDHKQLAACYQKSKNSSVRSVGHKLSKLKKWRSFSDYEIAASVQPTEKTAKEAIYYAQQIFLILDN